jgi:hypothetical protein
MKSCYDDPDFMDARRFELMKAVLTGSSHGNTTTPSHIAGRAMEIVLESLNQLVNADDNFRSELEDTDDVDETNDDPDWAALEDDNYASEFVEHLGLRPTDKGDPIVHQPNPPGKFDPDGFYPEEFDDAMYAMGVREENGTYAMNYGPVDNFYEVLREQGQEVGDHIFQLAESGIPHRPLFEWDGTEWKKIWVALQEDGWQDHGLDIDTQYEDLDE